MLHIKKYFKGYRTSKIIYFNVLYKILRLRIKYFPKNIHNIKIIKEQVIIYDPLRLGDLINCMYLIRAINETLPLLEIILIIRPEQRKIIEIFGLKVKFIYEFCPTWHGGQRKYFNLQKEDLKKIFLNTNPELVIETRGDPRDYFLLKKIFPKSIFLGYVPQELNEKIDWYSTHNIGGYYKAIFNQLISRYKISYSGNYYNKFNICSAEGNRIVIHFGASSRLRIIPENIAINIIKKLQHKFQNFEIVFLETSEITNNFVELKNLFSKKIYFKEISCLEDISNELIACKVFVGTDSGPAHIASAMGVPDIRIIYGPNLPQFSMPNDNSVKIIESSIELKCRPCGDKYCKNYIYQKCYLDININEVF